MQRALSVAVLVLAGSLAALAPTAPALEPVDSFVVYGEWEGTFVAGAPMGVGRVTGGPEGAVAAGPVNLARHGFVVNDCHRDVRVSLLFEPAAFEAETPLAAVAVPFEFEGWLVDAATGEAVHAEPFTWRAPGAFTVRLPEGGAFDVELVLRQGADVDYRLRASAFRSVDAECRHQGRVFVSEVEANPLGADSGNEWVEVHNAGFEDVDLSGWRVDALHGRPASLTLPNGTLIPAGARLIVAFDAQFLDNADERVTLTAPRGWVVDRTPALSDGANDARSWQRVPDASEEWAFVDATPGARNG